MTVTPVGHVATPVPAAAPGLGGATKASGASFEASLTELQQRAAARDVLAELPAPMAIQIVRKPPAEGPPNSAVHELFLGLQRGEQLLSDEQAKSGTLIGATYRATKVFDTPDQMWATMREMLGNVTAIGFGVRQALEAAGRAESSGALAALDAVHPPAAAPTPTSAAANAATRTEPEPAIVPLDGAASLDALAILGGALPAQQTDWWESVLLFLLPIPRGDASIAAPSTAARDETTRDGGDT